jgi:hypothetical protein
MEKYDMPSKMERQRRMTHTMKIQASDMHSNRRHRGIHDLRQDWIAWDEGLRLAWVRHD